MSASVLSHGGGHRRAGLRRRAQEREIRIERGAVYRADLRRSEKINRARPHAGELNSSNIRVDVAFAFRTGMRDRAFECRPNKLSKLPQRARSIFVRARLERLLALSQFRRR